MKVRGTHPPAPGRIQAAVALVVLVGSAAGALAQPESCFSDEERRGIEDAIERNVARLEANGKLAPPTEGSVLFAWPLRAANGLTDPGFHATTSQVDHDPVFPDALLDYNCGERTYDTTSRNHWGTDIEVWPFPWLRTQQNQVEVIAAAAGTIVYRLDGYLDTCTCDANSNTVAVRHSDGSTSWYGHMKRFSVTSKGVGAFVGAGEYLGVVGSSGCSYVPHLHFEAYDPFNYLQDPFQGACNGMNPASLWLEQPPYYDTAVNRIMTSSSPPFDPGCPNTELLNEQNVFLEWQSIYITTYFRDLVEGEVATYELLMPDRTVHSTWTHQIAPGVQHKSKAKITHLKWIWAEFAPSGMWRVDVHFAGEVHSHSFQVIGPPAPTPAGVLAPDLRVGKPTLDGLPLTWTHSSCNPGDTSYVVATGLMDYWNNHGYVTCGIADTFINVPLQQVAGNRYYLVAPRSLDSVGSFGLDGDGVERPPPTNTCDLEHWIDCP